MCTLTYLLTDNGYELFFNRDELRTRQPATVPALNHQLNAIYPVDRDGNGTWIAVHNSGLSLALLNFYQAEQAVNNGEYLSRGQIILSLLEDPSDIIGRLTKMDLKKYLAFQLGVFAAELCRTKNKLRIFQWDGKTLSEVDNTQPIISSGTAFARVSKIRKALFGQIISAEKPTRAQFFTYHNFQGIDPWFSVKMSRPEAHTVSLSHIVVSKDIQFNYLDHIDHQRSFCRMKRSSM